MEILLYPGAGITPSVGGQGSFCAFLAEGLATLGHSVTIAGGHAWAPFCHSRRVRLAASKPSAKFIRSMDIVHVNGRGVRAAAQGLLSGRRVVLTHQDYSCFCPASVGWTVAGCAAGGGRLGPCPNCPDRTLIGRLHMRALRGMARWCTNVAVSQQMLPRLSLRGAHAVLSPIRARAVSDCDEAGLLAFAGRLAPEKGLDTLIHALARLPEGRLAIAGDGPLRQHYELLVRRLGLEDRVRFLGQAPACSVIQLYARASIICTPSSWPEPFGYSAAEGMALGKPVVAAATGAFTELLADGRGWLCRPRDVDDWATTLAHALADPAERLRRGREAAAFVRRELDPTIVAHRYLDSYAAALERPPGHSPTEPEGLPDECTDPRPNGPLESA